MSTSGVVLLGMYQDQRFEVSDEVRGGTEDDDDVFEEEFDIPEHRPVVVAEPARLIPALVVTESMLPSLYLSSCTRMRASRDHHQYELVGGAIPPPVPTSTRISARVSRTEALTS